MVLFAVIMTLLAAYGLIRLTGRAITGWQRNAALIADPPDVNDDIGTAEQHSAACGWPEACRLGDDTAAMLCERCAGNPDARCTCPADCGRRYCTWATAVLDTLFTAELAELLKREGGQ